MNDNANTKPFYLSIPIGKEVDEGWDFISLTNNYKSFKIFVDQINDKWYVIISVDNDIYCRKYQVKDKKEGIAVITYAIEEDIYTTIKTLLFQPEVTFNE